jgi:glutathione S-transferase
VPALCLDDGQLLTEGPAIVQYLADLAPESGLAPAAGTLERCRLQEWLNFVATELHKMFSPWLFHPEHGDQAAQVARANLAQRFAYLNAHLAKHPYLLGPSFTAADAYAFTIIAWARLKHIDLAPFPHLKRYMDRVAARPKIQEAMQVEDLLPARRAASAGS